MSSLRAKGCVTLLAWTVLGGCGGGSRGTTEGGARGIDEDAGTGVLAPDAAPAALPAIAVPRPPPEPFPVVLLHGFFGWGRDELFGWKHFGGTEDLEAELIEEGYDTVTVAVGPLSSNWDRAAEMYAQLVGGTVDYGEAHARQHRHLRYGRTYDALVPGAGTIDAHGRVQRVNVIAHSQGAQTARVLISLLADGSAAERTACPAGACADGSRLSPLFAGDGPQWVHGLATLSGANDGSTLAHAIQNELNPNSLIAVLAIAVNTLGANALYDFKLDQFGLAARAPTEPLDAYVQRVSSTLLDAANRDTAFYDLSIDGAAEINRWARAQPDVTYFAWANHTSEAIPLVGQHRPMDGTNLFLWGFTAFMGAYDPRSANPAWADPRRAWENDGIVNSRSMSGPTCETTDVIARFDGTIRRGRWQVIGQRRGWDHWDMLGLLDLQHDFTQIRATYVEAARWLRASE